MGSPRVEIIPLETECVFCHCPHLRPSPKEPNQGAVLFCFCVVWGIFRGPSFLLFQHKFRLAESCTRVCFGGRNLKKYENKSGISLGFFIFVWLFLWRRKRFILLFAETLCLAAVVIQLQIMWFVNLVFLQLNTWEVPAILVSHGEIEEGGLECMFQIKGC